MANLEQIGDKITNINPAGITSAIGSWDWSPLWFWGKTIFYVMLCIGAAAFIYKNFLVYKIRVTVVKRLGASAVEITYDRAKEIVDLQGKRKLVLRKTKKDKIRASCPVPAGMYKGKTGKNDHYILWLDDNFQLHPIASPTLEGIKLPGADGEIPVESHANLRLRPQERDAWALAEVKLLQEKYAKKDLLKEYLPAGILIASMAIGFLIMFFAFKSLEGSANAVGIGLQQVASSCTRAG